MKLGTQEVVVISSADYAIELLDRRSPIYSSRPRQVMAEELISRGLRLTFMPYHDLWRKERKLIHKLTSAQASSTYEPMQELESTQLMIDMLDRPKAFWGHCQRYAGSLIMQIAFNKRASRNTDPAVVDMRALLEELTSAAVPGRYLVDSLPWLNYLPNFLAPWKREAATIFEKQNRLFGGHMQDVKKQVAAGQDAHCFVKYLVDGQKESGITDQEIAFLAGVMYGAGSDTTSDAIATFIMTMLNNPDKQRKAQEEIDRVVGRDRMPSFEDQADLIYVGALVKEVQRWRPVIAGGLAHATTKDDIFQDYFIPKGSTVIPKYALSHQMSCFRLGTDKLDRCAVPGQFIWIRASIPSQRSSSLSALSRITSWSASISQIADTLALAMAAASAPECILPNDLFSLSSPACCGASASQTPKTPSASQSMLIHLHTQPASRHTRKSSCAPSAQGTRKWTQSSVLKPKFTTCLNLRDWPSSFISM